MPDGGEHAAAGRADAIAQRHAIADADTNRTHASRRGVPRAGHAGRHGIESPTCAAFGRQRSGAGTASAGIRAAARAAAHAATATSAAAATTTANADAYATTCPPAHADTDSDAAALHSDRGAMRLSAR